MNELTIGFMIFTVGYMIGCIITIWVFRSLIKKEHDSKRMGDER